jgi:radical SAM protein with 4Fe4S-binding SPASM domain
MAEFAEMTAIVDEAGRLVFPRDVAADLGLAPGTRIRLEKTPAGAVLHRAATHLAKVYIEPTSRCNLDCEICIRNSWSENQGDMSRETFDRLLESVRSLAYKPSITFGGFGEPLLHRRIMEMIWQAKAVANRVEVITNGLLLTEEMARELICLGLDAIWFSTDSSHSEANTGRLNVFSTIERLHSVRQSLNSEIPETGCVFVATSSNIEELPSLLRESHHFGVSRYMVTNVLPYTADMCSQALYTRALDNFAGQPSPWLPLIQLPRMDWNKRTMPPLSETLRLHHNVQIDDARLDLPKGLCPFIEAGAVAVSWDGSVSPCLALMHSHVSYLQEKPRTISRYVIGNVNELSLKEIWNDAEHLSFRQRVQEFNFSPCTSCGGCDLVETNQEDCVGNGFPTCGGCLWAWGVIQCP